MKFLKDFFSLNFNDLEFEGLRLFWSNENLPWNSKSEREKYLEKLIDEGSEYSSLRYKSLFKQMVKREIHIKISRSLIFKLSALLFMILAILVGFKGFLFGSFILLGFSLGLYIFNNFFNRRAKELYIGFDLGEEINDYMFQKKFETSE